MIKYTIEKVITDRDLDAIVEETYGRPFCYQQQDGCRERRREYVTVPVSHPYDYPRNTIEEKVNGDEMGVSFEAWLARDPKQPLNTTDRWDREHGLPLFWQRNFYPSIDMVLNDLHAKGLIEAGDYTIDIDW